MSYSEDGAPNPRRVFARLVGNRVAEIVTELNSIEAEWHPRFLEMCEEVTHLEPRPVVGWRKTEEGVFEPPPEYVPSPAHKRAIALRDGARIRGSRGKSPRVYPMTSTTWARMGEVAFHIKMFDEFPGGAKTYTWPSDPPHQFSNTADFLRVYRRLSAWRESWNQHVDGGGDVPGTDVPDEG